MCICHVWFHLSADCSGLIQGRKVAEAADYLEERCHCGISGLYLQGEKTFSHCELKPSHVRDDAFTNSLR